MIVQNESLRTLPRICSCGVQLDPLSMEDVIDKVHMAVRRRQHLAISVVNVAKVVNMRHDELLRESVVSGDLVLADGMPLVWMSRLQRRPLPQRVAGIDLMYRIFELADRRGLRVFLLGAKPTVLARVIELVRERYPRLVIAGHRDGYFTEDEQEDVANAIREAEPDVLIVAMTSPKKEIFMKRWSEYMDVPVCHGVGGSFDVMAGVTKRAPAWMQKRGLEWFYRLVQEPRRMWKRYLRTNARFMMMAPRCILCRMKKECHLVKRQEEMALPVMHGALLSHRAQPEANVKNG